VEDAVDENVEKRARFFLSKVNTFNSVHYRKTPFAINRESDLKKILAPRKKAIFWRSSGAKTAAGVSTAALF
jgi:hypothetical protein